MADQSRLDLSTPVAPSKERGPDVSLKQLATALDDPSFRNREGFPNGSNEDILALSDPPFFTACPNPFVEQWLHSEGKPFEPNNDNYHREPFASDVSEGKNDPIYNAHGYHTKVPHKAVMRYILHYTDPGDAVYDGFCGTGMTGVAAQLCGQRATVASLGLRVEADGTILEGNGNPFSKLGARRAVLSDLSPVAAFVAYNYNTPVDVSEFRSAVKVFFERVERELGWMYETAHHDGRTGRINYVVWSEVFVCPHCAGELVFYDIAMDESTGRVATELECTHCRAEVRKRDLARAFETYYDRINKVTAKRVKRVPTLINYAVGAEKHQKRPSEADVSLLKKIETTAIPYFFPAIEVPYMHVTHVKDRMSNFGITHFSQFFLPRQQHAVSVMWEIASRWPSRRVRNALIFMVEQCIWGLTLMNRYSPVHFSQVNQYMSGVFYLPSQTAETSPWYMLDKKSQRLAKVFSSLQHEGSVRVSVNSGSAAPIPDSSIDYIFTDPPFGENLQYSELNWFNETFYGVLPDTKPEAVVNKAQGKSTEQYKELMLRCFRENYRVLKPGRWMTVEFHNSQNVIWNAIHEAVIQAGFVVADVRTLDKKKETYKQLMQGTVKADLVISCYKPRSEFEERFSRLKGQPASVVEFVRQHLDMLPVAPKTSEGKIETVIERTRFMLFDRMVAYHLQQNAPIPLSAAEFYAMLNEQFVERDEMYFLHDQAVRYDALRARAEVEQLTFYVRDERSAVLWLRKQLLDKPQTLSDLTPKFMQEARDWDDREPRFELRDLLKENFILDDGGYWRVPDPAREKDLEAIRRKLLLKIFDGYAAAKGTLKVFRREAMLEGFKHCWQTKQYGVIVAVSEKIPAKVLQEIQDFVQFYDIAKELATPEARQLEFNWEA